MENKILKWGLILSIVIVANLFFAYSLSLILNGPNHDEFCPFEKTSQIIEDKNTCEQQDGIWNPGEVIDQNQKIKSAGYCDLYSKCSHQFEEANKIYEKKVFIALIAIGVLVLISSLVFKNNAVLSVAIPIIAVLDFVIASIRYWRYSDELLKISILFLALVALIYFAVKKFKN